LRCGLTIGFMAGSPDGAERAARQAANWWRRLFAKALPGSWRPDVQR